ncbi:MAG: hypothetical protein ACO32I_09365, partial [Candidatus Limnocylindrus sp.]
KVRARWRAVCAVHRPAQVRRPRAAVRDPTAVHHRAVPAHNLVLLRWKQGDVSHLDQTDITARYEPALREALGDLLGVPTKVHGLRAIYLALVYATHTTPYTLQRVAMHVLGHQSLSESNSYNFVRLTRLGKYEQAFGDLH